MESVTHERPDILIVDDQPSNLAILSHLLSDGGYRVRAVTNGARALEAARAQRPACILLDIHMPGMDGFSTCEALQADPTLRDVPVVFLTAQDDLETKVRAFNAGGRDYISKPFQAEEVLARVRLQVRLSQLEQMQRAKTEALREANARLQEAAELKARLTAMLVHDLRQPLTVLGALTYLPADPDTLRDARAAYDRLDQLIAEVLDLSRIEQGTIVAKQAVAEVSAVLEVVLRQVRHAAEQKQVTLHYHRSDEPLEVRADVMMLDRMLINLLDNAIRYSPHAGRVSVSAGREVGVGVEAGIEFVAIVVTDEGPGIPPEDLPFVFDPYLRARNSEGNGYGLGLAIVARAVAQHGGRIQIRSQVGIGTEFHVRLPRVTP